VVLYTKANSQDAVQSMQTAPVVTGKLEKVVTSSGVSTYTVAGKDYVVSENGTTSMTTANLNKDVSFYVDAQGNIMKDKDAADAALTYIYILGNAAPRQTAAICPPPTPSLLKSMALLLTVSMVLIPLLLPQSALLLRTHMLARPMSTPLTAPVC
jgi:hypothetical protein